VRPGIVEEGVLYAVGVVHRQIAAAERAEHHKCTRPDQEAASGKEL